MNRFTVLSAVLGFVCIVASAAWIYRPLGPLVAGAMFMGMAFATARRKRRTS